MICPIQLLRPAKKPMAGPSSCKGQNKVGDNFKIGAQRVNVLVSSMCSAFTKIQRDDCALNEVSQLKNKKGIPYTKRFFKTELKSTPTD